MKEKDYGIESIITNKYHRTWITGFETSKKLSQNIEENELINYDGRLDLERIDENGEEDFWILGTEPEIWFDENRIEEMAKELNTWLNNNNVKIIK